MPPRTTYCKNREISMTATKTKKTKKATARTQRTKKPVKLSEAEQLACLELAKRILDCVEFAAIQGKDAFKERDVFDYLDIYLGMTQRVPIDDDTPLVKSLLANITAWLPCIRHERQLEAEFPANPKRTDDHVPVLLKIVRHEKRSTQSRHSR